MNISRYCAGFWIYLDKYGQIQYPPVHENFTPVQTCGRAMRAPTKKHRNFIVVGRGLAPAVPRIRICVDSVSAGRAGARPLHFDCFSSTGKV